MVDQKAQEEIAKDHLASLRNSLELVVEDMRAAASNGFAVEFSIGPMPDLNITLKLVKGWVG